MPIKIDLHVHSYLSYDSLITPKELIFYAKKRGLDGVAITDHDRLDSAVEIAKETDFFIIPGMEVSSSNGHIVALNVKEPIAKGLSAEETVDKIHDACGIAVACHPITFYKASLGKHVSSRFDAVEVINASAFPFKRSVEHAQRLASELGLARVGGTDAHYGPEIGYAYTVVDADLSVEGVMESIRKGLCEPFGEPIPLTMRLKKEFLTLKKRFR